MEAYRAAGAEACAACPPALVQVSRSLVKFTVLASSLGPFALDSVTARACAHLTSLGPAVSTPRSPHPLSPPLYSAVGRVARRMVATMASSLLLRPRAVLPPHPSSSSRRPLPAPRAQLQANIQQKPGLTARSDGERRQPAGTRLYSLAPYPLLLAALLPGGTA